MSVAKATQRDWVDQKLVVRGDLHYRLKNDALKKGKFLQDLTNEVVADYLNPKKVIIQENLALRLKQLAAKRKKDPIDLLTEAIALLEKAEIPETS